MKLSIIIPVYNVEPYLVNCLESILNQSFTDYELILIDDGSTDQSGQICDIYAQKDSRIVVIHQMNSGVSSARNAGLDIAIGQYITFVDPDDIIDHDTYLVNMRVLSESLDIDILQFPVCIDYENVSAEKVVVNSKMICGETNIFANWWEGTVLNPYIWNKIFKREIFSTIRFSVGHISEDWLLVVEFSKLANKVFISEEGCYFYRVRNDSLSNSSYSLSKHIDLFVAQFKIYKNLYSFENLCSVRLRAFSRVFRRLISAQNSYHDANLDNFISDLKKYVPKWKDLLLSSDTDEYIWFFFVKVFGLRNFLYLFCKYLKIRNR